MYWATDDELQRRLRSLGRLPSTGSAISVFLNDKGMMPDVVRVRCVKRLGWFRGL